MAGVTKLSPILDPVAHQNLHDWAKGWTGVVHIPVQYADLYCNAIGAAEALGAILLLIPQTTFLANLLFIAIMAGANYTHFALQHPLPNLSTYLLAGLVVRLLVLFLLPSSRSSSKSSSKNQNNNKKKQ